MIDIEDKIFAQIAKYLRDKFPGLYVTGERVNSPSQFPHVSIEEVDNSTSIEHMDSSSSEKLVRLMYEVNIYSNKAKGKKSECKDILAAVDDWMYKRNFIRFSKTPVPNLNNSTIYRIVAQYRCVTDGKVFYRR